MKLKVYLTGIIFISCLCLFSQEKEAEAYKKTFRSELKVIESKLVRRPNDPHLNYKYGLLCYRLCRYREAQRVLYKYMETNKNNAYYFLDLYHIELALKNKQAAQEYYYKYLVLSKKLSGESDDRYSYQEVYTKEFPSIVNPDPNSIEYFPFILNNDRVKFLTLKDFTYTEPTSPLLFRNYLTDIVVFSDREFRKLNRVKQPNKDSEGFSYGTFCLNKNQDKIFMTRYDGSHQRMIICVSEKNGLNWGPFRTLTYFSKNTKFNFIHPMLTKNEDKLIFASNMNGGYGGYDLWIADITENHDLKNISNLGNTINTMGNECFPTCYNEDEIFFSSDGHPGYGSLDIYRVNIMDTSKSHPINLGSGINSSRDDYGLFYTQDAKTAYFTSNRSFSNANLFIDKIYKIKVNVFNCELINCEIRNPIQRLEVTDNASQSASSEGEYENHNKDNTQNLTNTPSSLSLNTNRESNQKGGQLGDDIQSDRTNHMNSSTVGSIEEESAPMANDNSNDILKQSSNRINESVQLYQDKNEKINEKFVQYADKASIANPTTNGIVENKFWATVKLWFADYNIPIGFTYVRVINPKNEVIYSNFSSQNGLISVEVVEANEYIIEIPRFRTMKKGIVFNSGENNFFFPYDAPLESNHNSTARVKRNELKTPARKSNNAKKENKKIMNSKLSIAKSYLFIPHSNYSKHTIPRKSANSKNSNLDKKSVPRNMIENFN